MPSGTDWGNGRRRQGFVPWREQCCAGAPVYPAPRLGQTCRMETEDTMSSLDTAFTPPPAAA